MTPLSPGSVTPYVSVYVILGIDMFSLRRTSFHIALIAVLGLLVYSNTFDVPFHYDDITNIVRNPSAHNPPGYFSPPEILRGLGSPRYMGYTSFTLNYMLHGIDPVGYHLVNLFVHIASALLVYAFVILTFRTHYLTSALKGYSPFVALFSGLLFVSHPVQTQAVTYIVQRFTSLATLFYLASLVLYIKWRGSQPRGSRTPASKGSRIPLLPVLYALSLLSALFAVKTKEIAFTLPFALVLYEFMFFEGARLRRLLPLVPFFLVAALIPWSFATGDANAGSLSADFIEDVGSATRLQTSISRWDYLYTEIRVMVTYLRLIVLPVNQNLDYDYPLYSSLFDSGVFLSLLFVLTLIVLAIFLPRLGKDRGQWRLVSFGLLWFFLTLSPESSLIPIADVIYEHRLYLPVAGLFPAMAAVVFMGGPKRVKAGSIALMTVVLVFSVSAYARNSVWQSKIDLWEDAAGKSPFKARPNYNLANAYSEKGMLDKAINQYRRVISIRPDCTDAYTNLGVAYASKGLYKEAGESFDAAIRARPGFAKAHYNMGLLEARTGKTDEAVRHFEEAIRLDPGYAEAMVNLAVLYLSDNMAERATEYLQRAITLSPGNADAHANLGLAYLKNGLLKDARREFQTALEINPAHDLARRMLAGVIDPL